MSLLKNYLFEFCILIFLIFSCVPRFDIVTAPNLCAFNVEPHLIIPKFNNEYAVSQGRPIADVFADFAEEVNKVKPDEIFAHFIQTAYKMILQCDQYSYHVIDFIFANMYYYSYHQSFYNNFPDFERYHNKQYERELQSIKEKYNCTYHLQEAFYFKHGIKLAPSSVRDFISERDILDVGAFIGDSAIALDDCTKGKIVSYEFAPSTFDHLQRTLRDNKMNNNRHIAVRKGVSSKREVIKVSAVGSIDAKISNTFEDGVETDITTVDYEVKRLNLNPGFIKADIEGFGLDLVMGSKQTIQKYRPVFYIAAYHRASELVGVPNYLARHDYLIRYYLENVNMLSMGEICIFAYPRELILNQPQMN